ncbi:MAG: hypothetical protein IJS81_09920 [Selenomonadaceae bacterium]|nr:hypothetical protein [Selenomonadaceae bacterium]
MNVISTPKFKDDIKYYMKKKRYLKINDDVSTVTDELENGNLVGDKLEDLDIPEGTAAYKVRIANSSANVGKSNGFRLLYYVAIGDDIYLLSIYSKKDDIRVINDKQIELLIQNILNESLT